MAFIDHNTMVNNAVSQEYTRKFNVSLCFVLTLAQKTVILTLNES
jgi:hypothetical protein